MAVAIIEYPGSTDVSQISGACRKILNTEPVMIHHMEESLPSSVQAVILPGGYSYGDYLRPGALARNSPATGAVIGFARKGGRVLGIGNGFQILCEAGLLPGALLQNASQKFAGGMARLSVETADNSYGAELKGVSEIKMPLACYFGRYIVNSKALRELKQDNRVLLRYVEGLSATQSGYDSKGNAGESVGAMESVAAVTTKDGKILGMMPHPERAVDKAFGSDDGLLIFRALFTNLSS